MNDTSTRPDPVDIGARADEIAGGGTMSYVTDEAAKKAAALLPEHEFRVDSPAMVPYCTCGWSAEKYCDVAAFDEHVARIILEATTLPIAAQTLRDAFARLDRAARVVDSTHHFHGTQCSCGFTGDARKRTQTEHITAAVLALVADEIAGADQ